MKTCLVALVIGAALLLVASSVSAHDDGKDDTSAQPVGCLQLAGVGDQKQAPDASQSTNVLAASDCKNVVCRGECCKKGEICCHVGGQAECARPENCQ